MPLTIELTDADLRQGEMQAAFKAHTVVQDWYMTQRKRAIGRVVEVGGKPCTVVSCDAKTAVLQNEAGEKNQHAMQGKLMHLLLLPPASAPSAPPSYRGGGGRKSPRK